METDPLTMPGPKEGLPPVPQAVLQSLTRAAIFLVVTLNPGVTSRSVVRSFCGDIPGLLRAVGFRDIDPLVKDRQFCDVGDEYRTVIFVHDEEQRRLAEESKKRVEAQLKAPVYTEIGTGFASHETVNHSIKEYVRGDAHTNTVEGYFSIFKRGIYGVYHHVSEQHLKRYLCEFDFRYNERIALGVGDDERMTKALSGIVGKRLTYRRTRGAEADEAAPF